MALFLPFPLKCLTSRRLLAACVLWAALPVSALDVIRLNVAPGGFPPYTIIADGQPPSGIVVDVLREVTAKTGHQLRTLEIPRNRVERMVLADELDASARAMEWTPDPQQFLFTDPILNVQDVIFSNKSAPLVYTAPADLDNKRVGTRLGYSYPVLNPGFNSGLILRSDASNERAALAMLELKRVDAAVLNEMTALWIIKNEGWNDRFIYSHHPVDSYPYRIMFHKKWGDFVTVFNRELAAMKKDGRLARTLQKYQPDRAVSKN